MALVIVYQAFYHMCISVGVMPVSGQTLPFISKGGTSILVMSVAMGMMLSVSRFAVERTDTGLKTIDDDDELPDDLKADNPAGGF
jgi:cell division protein FtsW